MSPKVGESSLPTWAHGLEVTVNAIIRRVAPKLPRELRTVAIAYDKVELGVNRPLSVGQLAKLQGDRPALHRAFRLCLEHTEWTSPRFE